MGYYNLLTRRGQFFGSVLHFTWRSTMAYLSLRCRRTCRPSLATVKSCASLASTFLSPSERKAPLLNYICLHHLVFSRCLCTFVSEICWRNIVLGNRTIGWQAIGSNMAVLYTEPLAIYSCNNTIDDITNLIFSTIGLYYALWTQPCHGVPRKIRYLCLLFVVQQIVWRTTTVSPNPTHPSFLFSTKL